MTKKSKEKNGARQWKTVGETIHSKINHRIKGQEFVMMPCFH
jgi:hypothetical protein